MNCPFCGLEDQDVLNTRVTYKGFANWRRRKCQSCKEVFTTYEYINLTYIKVIKRNGDIRVYSRARLYSGIFVAFRSIKHIDSGEAAAVAEEVTKDIEKLLIAKKTKKITTQDLALCVSKLLVKKNYTAFVNYTSYFFTPESYKKVCLLVDDKNALKSRIS